MRGFAPLSSICQCAPREGYFRQPPAVGQTPSAQPPAVGADAFGRAARMGCPRFVVWVGKTWKGYSPVPGAKIRTLRQAQGGSGAPRFSCGDMGHPPAKFSTSMRLPHRAGSVHGKAIWQQLAAHAQPNFRIADQPGVDRLFNAYRTMSSMVWPETLSGH